MLTILQKARYKMIQCFARQNFTSAFAGAKTPRLLSASKIDAAYSRHPRILHKHENLLEILLVRGGSGTYIVDEKRYAIQKGDIVICNRAVLHDEDPAESKEISTYCCALSDVEVAGREKNCLIPAGACPVVPSGAMFQPLEDLMRLIYALLSSDAESNGESCAHLGAALVSLVARIVQRHGGGLPAAKRSGGDALAARVKAYVDNRYDEPLTLRAISGAFHINPYYLAHLFKDSTGYSLMRYILRRRIGEAQSLLIATDYSITQISGMVGYGNPSHFNVLFAKYVGMSPTAYRRTYTKT